LDDESSSTDDAEDFILKTSPNARFKLIIGSILDKSLLNKLIGQNIDIIFHLAAKLGVKKIIDNQLEMLETNVDGTKNVLEFAAAFKIPTFIASSSEVYAKNEEIPFKENSNLTLGEPSIARWGYAASKILDEF
jgi:UDP-glucose 4-epimerase